MAQPESPNSYANSIPALQVVGDPAAQALLGATRTNGVVAGTPVLRQDARKNGTKKQSQKIKCFDAQLKRQELEQEIAAAEGRIGAIALPWAMQLNIQLNILQNKFNVFQNQMIHVDNALQDLGARLNASSQNSFIRSTNKIEEPVMIPLRTLLCSCRDYKQTYKCAHSLGELERERRILDFIYLRHALEQENAAAEGRIGAIAPPYRVEVQV